MKASALSLSSSPPPVKILFGSYMSTLLMLYWHGEELYCTLGNLCKRTIIVRGGGGGGEGADYGPEYKSLRSQLIVLQSENW